MQQSLKEHLKEQLDKEESSNEGHETMVNVVTVGINEVTRRLKQEGVFSVGERSPALVLCFMEDTKAPQLYRHLPALCHRRGNVRLVTLTQGSERKLALALKLKRASAIMIQVQVE